MNANDKWLLLILLQLYMVIILDIFGIAAKVEGFRAIEQISETTFDFIWELEARFYHNYCGPAASMAHQEAAGYFCSSIRGNMVGVERRRELRAIHGF